MRTLRAQLTFWSLLLSILFMAMLLFSSVVLMNSLRKNELVLHEKNTAQHMADQIEVVLHDLYSRFVLIDSSDTLRRLMSTPRHVSPLLLRSLTVALRQEFYSYVGQSSMVEGLVVIGRNDYLAIFYPDDKGGARDYGNLFSYHDFASNPLLSPYFYSGNSAWYAAFDDEAIARARSDELLYRKLDGYVILAHTVYGEDNIILGKIILMLTGAIFEDTLPPMLEEGAVITLSDASGRTVWQSGEPGNGMALMLEHEIAPLSLTLTSYLPESALRVDSAMMLRRLLPAMACLLLLIIPVAFFCTRGYSALLDQMNRSMGAGLPTQIDKRTARARSMWNRVPMRRLLTGYFMLTVTVPTLIFSVLVFRDTYLDYKALAIKDARRSTHNLQISLRQRLTYLDNVSQIFVQNPDVASLSAVGTEAGITEAEQLSLDRLSHRLRRLTNQLLSVNLYTLEGQNIYSSQYLENQPAGMFTGGFMRQLRAAGERLNYLGMAQALYPDVPLLFGRVLTASGQASPWGYGTLLMEQSFLTEPAGNTQLGKTGYFFLLSEDGQWLSHNKSRTTAEFLTGDILSALLDAKGGIHHFTGDARYDLFHGFLDDVPLCVVGVIPRGEIVEQVLPLAYASLLLSSVYLFLSIVVAALVSRRISKPLRVLSRLIMGVGSGEWVQMQYNSRNEIGLLVEQYNEMVRRLGELIHENYTTRLRESHLQLAQKEAQFKALQQQINPHFLYNTLDAIKWMAHKKGATEAYDMTVALGNFFRGVITQKADTITVEEELALLKSYIFIQKIRFGDRFDIEWDVGPDVMGERTLKLMLQPLVENAIVHGIEQVEEGGMITISVRRADDCLEYRVSDNGAGIDDKTLEYLTALLQGEGISDQSRSIGLPNVYRRLKLRFGDAAQMEVHSNSGQGTLVVVRFPLMPPEETPAG